jgi:hypothetical protein
MLGEETQLHYLKFRLPSTMCSRWGACGSTKICYPQPPKVFGDNVNVPPRMQSMQAADVIVPQSSGCREIRLERLPNARSPQGPSPEIIFDASTRSEIFSRTRYVTVS